MEFVEIKDREKLRPLFEGCGDTLIQSALSGYMGSAWADNAIKPTVAKVSLGDFSYLGGDATSPEVAKLIRHKSPDHKLDVALFICSSKDLEEELVRVCGENAHAYERYALKKEPHVFDYKKLEQNLTLLPHKYDLRMIDEDLFYSVKEEEWSKQFTFAFPCYEDYQNHGLGVVVTEDGIPIAGASSYSAYPGGIEIEIVTRENHRREGLAMICASKLIIECGKKGYYPSWDAANTMSLALSEKLGYHFDKEYLSYCVKYPEAKSNDVLIGMPSAGKSTIGVVLAKVKRKSFVDTDILIQEKTGKQLCEIIEEGGLQAFLDLESEVIRNLDVTNCVIATGGSAVYSKEAMEHLSQTGNVIYLKRSIKEIAMRVGDLEKRGVALNEGQTLRDIYYERRPLYEKYADITIDCNEKTTRDVITMIFRCET